MTRRAVNGVHLNVIEQGAGPPLVLLHGFTGSAAGWGDIAASLAEHFRVIAIDLLGHGDSDSPPDPERYRVEPAVADLAAVLDQLDAGPVHLLGYSMGGRLALHLAAARPERVRSLVLESASPGLADAAGRAARSASDAALAARLDDGGLEAFVDYWESLPLFASQAGLPAEARAALRAQRLRNSAHGLANSLRGLGTGVQSSLWDRLPRLSVASLLIAGHLDEKFTDIARRMAAALPEARLEIVDGAGHTVHLEQPAAFCGAVRRFLDDHR